MNYLVAALTGAAFLLSLASLHIVSIATSALGTIKKTLSVLTNANVSDVEKEKSSKRAAATLFYVFISLFINLLLSTTVALILLYTLSWLAHIHAKDVFKALASLPFLAGTTVLVVLIFFMSKPRLGYSTFDRWLHRLAFATTGVQMDLHKADWKMEKSYIRILDNKDYPLFICGLPRAGTTAMLQLAHAANTYATHIYADMPFVPIPLLWRRFSQSFRSNKKPVERWHGDGVHISQASPEALDEVIFRQLLHREGHGHNNHAFLPDDYQMEPLTIDRLQDHFFRVVQARGNYLNRYMSKNNANVFRIPALTRAFSHAIVLVMFRHPYHQAQSLLHQHLNFSNMQRRDPFVLKYMDHIGQQFFGFGMKKPGFVQAHQWKKSTGDLGFWVEYWQYVYGGLLKQSLPDRVVFIDFDNLVAHDPRTLYIISLQLAIPLAKFQSLAREHITVRERPMDKHPDPKWEESHPEAMSIYRQLRSLSHLKSHSGLL